MSVPLPSHPKRLHRMNRLEDMGRFPVVVYLGATANVLAEILFFYWLYGRAGGRFSVGFVAAVLLVAGNLLPVVLLRLREGAAGLADTPPIEEMGFVRDQHRFASWVYAVASGNLFLWLMLAWAAFEVKSSLRMLLAVEGLAFLCTFAPAWAPISSTSTCCTGAAACHWTKPSQPLKVYAKRVKSGPGACPISTWTTSKNSTKTPVHAQRTRFSTTWSTAARSLICYLCARSAGCRSCGVEGFR